jgi:DNA polymerase elongation subunit (family B)
MAKLKQKAEKFLADVNKRLPGIMELELQGIYKRGLFIPRRIGVAVAKKRYALIDERGVLTIRGLEVVRRDWIDAAKELQHRIIEIVLKQKDVRKAIKKSIAFTRDIIKKIRSLRVDLKDMIIYEQLVRPIETYRVLAPHVVAARKMRARDYPVGAGSLIAFVITKGTGKISERAEPAPDVTIKDIDVDYYIGHQIVPAALRVLQVFGVTEQQLISK